MLEQLKAAPLSGIASAYAEGDCWLLVKNSGHAGTVERHPMRQLQTLLQQKEVALLPVWREACRVWQPSTPKVSLNAKAKRVKVLPGVVTV
eukprot:7350438-Prymnesium_polylepis.3